MGLRDRISDAIGGAIGSGIELMADSLEKANNRPRSDEPSARGGGSMAMTSAQGRSPLPPDPPSEDPKALLYDPFALIDQLGYRDRPTGLTYGTLREMSRRVPTYTGILQTRINQVSSFGQRQKDPRDPGFGIILRDSKATPTRQDKIRARQLEDMVLQTGVQWAPGRDDFRTYLRKITRDSLDLDQGCTEIQRDRKSRPCAFYALDGGTMRLADVPPGAEATQDPNQVKYVQVYDEVIISEFAAHEVCFGVRNPRSDIRVNGYGFSELEMLINVITATLWAFEYNKRQFSQGSLVNGVMNMKGSVGDAKLDSFRRQWKMMIAGVSNAHRVPFTNVDELQWIDFQKSNRDMEYGEWMDWLIKITCAVMQFDPAEINFTYGNSGQSQGSMFSSPVDQKLKASKDRGLRPLLKDIATWLNVHVIWPLDPYMEFSFLGIDAKSADQAIELAKKESEFKKTVDELRAEDDLPPMPDGKGEVILNPVWLQASQAADAMAQQEEMGEEGDEQMGDVMGMPGAGGDDEDADVSPGNDDDFSDLFPEKSDRQRSTLRKSGRRAKVRVYDIEL
jgi:hypothetical protein